jgi:hypothetical protein
LDPVQHNDHLRLNGQTISNVAMTPNGRNIRKKMSEPRIINFKCDVHIFMNAAIFVAKNPYFLVTDKNGKYTISNIPPGNYRVQIWHEALPPQGKEIVITPHKTMNISVELSSK